MPTKNTKTKLKLWLSTGNVVTVYYDDDCSGSIETEIRIATRRGLGFYIQNWAVSQVIIEDGDDTLIMNTTEKYPDMIDGSKIIGWSTEDR